MVDLRMKTYDRDELEEREEGGVVHVSTCPTWHVDLTNQRALAGHACIRASQTRLHDHSHAHAIMVLIAWAAR